MSENPNATYPEQIPLRHLVIVGGGTAGWMSAAALSHVLSPTGLKITLVESDDIPTVGVGEATIPQITLFTSLLGLDEDEFVRRTQATFKLGIEFRNWDRIGSRYIHPFGNHGVDMHGIRFHHFWLRARQLGLEKPFDEFCLQALAARESRFTRPVRGSHPPLSRIQYAFHFDAGLFAGLLRELAEADGVTRHEGLVEHVVRDPESGDITTLKLASGETIDGDFFIDCTGFRARLIGQEMGSEYIDWSHWLPVNRAMATACESPEEPRPYTQAIAERAGWRWRIPLQNRLGNGYVFSDQFEEPDAAETLLRNALEGDPVGPFRRLQFTTGHRGDVWRGNCLAMGLSAGFLEPLESTSIHLVQTSLSRFIAAFPSSRIDPAERHFFNAQVRTEYAQIRDFLILHYKATQRSDTPFWNYVRTMDVPESVTERMRIFEAHGRVHRDGVELFNESSWLSVLIGQGVTPKGYHPLAGSVGEADLMRRMDGISQTLDASVKQMPLQSDYIDRHCRAR